MSSFWLHTKINSRSLICLLVAECLVVISAMTSEARSVQKRPFSGSVGNYKVDFGRIGDQPSPPQITWIGIGDLARVTVDNVGLIGLYQAPEDWDGTYDESWLDDMTNWDGLVAEYPRDSRQFYIFSSGLWIGAKYPLVSDGDTTWDLRVATGAYEPDVSGMSPLYLSTQIISPDQWGTGDYLFAQPGYQPAPYQRLWEYADTASINLRRRAFFGSGQYDLNPSEGNMVSQQDSWCVWGDWIPEEQAIFLWPCFGYDTDGLGIRVEQRTYSWDSDGDANYVFLDYKIKNMNEFSLDNLYVGYFMDADIGLGYMQGTGAYDDLLGFDKFRHLGYCYDANGYELDWDYPAGYIGTAFLKTPADTGMTGFQTWSRVGPEGIVIYEQMDRFKYMQLVGDYDGQGHATPDDPDTATFEIMKRPYDATYLMGSGPYDILAPGEEVEVTLAMIAAYTLEELKEYADSALALYNRGYVVWETIISDVEVSPGPLEPGEEIQVTAYVWDPDGISGVSASFEALGVLPTIYTITLHDDGHHGDGIAGDHIYGNSWTTESVGRAYLVGITAEDGVSNTRILEHATSFTTLGPVTAVCYRVAGQDKIPNPGDSLQFQIRLENRGQGIVSQVTASASMSIGGAEVLSFGDIPPGEVAESLDSLAIFIPEDWPPGESIELCLSIADSAAVISRWLDSLTILVGDRKGYPGDLPKSFLLSQNYPNPFNAATTITYALPQDQWVKLEVYNVLGQKVITLVDGQQRAGYETVRWDAGSYASGIYFYRVRAGGYTKTRKMVLLR